MLLGQAATSLFPRTHICVNGHTVVGGIAQLLFTHLGSRDSRRRGEDKEELSLLHLPAERTRCFPRWRLRFTSRSQRQSQSHTVQARAHKCGKAMGPCGSAPRLGVQTYSPPDAGKHQNLRGIVGQEEGAGAGGRLRQSICRLRAWREGDKQVRTRRPTRQVRPDHTSLWCGVCQPCSLQKNGLTPSCLDRCRSVLEGGFCQ